MRKPLITALTGTVVPLGALRTEQSCGIGEYSDLEAFADFCKAGGLRAIQLLPVNDTGTESSPYSVCSAFALHPIYLSIARIPEYAAVPRAEVAVTQLRENFEHLPRFSYREVLAQKLAILRLLYDENAKTIAEDAELRAWIKANPWITAYAVYKELKRANAESSWKELPSECRAAPTLDIHDRWYNPELRANHLFFAWVQFRADEQFKKAAEYVASLSIILKGDIPILLNEDSCDVWAHPEFFNLKMRAGAPPDMYNAAGQNWGFPVYDWDALKKTDYSWWKDRLLLASRYYKAYRIDHILGFFRIWQMNAADVTAYLGRPDPILPISKRELLKTGLDDERIRWISKPHVPTEAVQNAAGGDYSAAHGYLNMLLDRIGTEELWLFKRNVAGEKDILNAAIPQPVKDVLMNYWHDRVLFEYAPEKFSPLWTHTDSSAWKTLSEEEKAALETLFEKKNTAMEKKWEEHARIILKELVGCTNMIACAEDLGVSLHGVSKVLKELSILSLRVIRWNRFWARKGEPFVPFAQYPQLGVTTLSVHDSSTAREWWEKEGGAALMLQTYKRTAGKTAGTAYTPNVANWLIQLAATSASVYCIHPIQDFLALCAEYYNPDPKEERINMPGTVSDFNWTYRLPTTVETLRKNAKFVKAIFALSETHRKAFKKQREKPADKE